jgi:GTP-binding protein HflX
MDTRPPVPRAILVGIQLPGVDDIAHAASLAELGRLVKTLGYEVVGTMSQKRDEIGGATVLGKGRLQDRRDRRRRIDGAAPEIEGPRAL